MEILNIKENADGSALMTIEISSEENRNLLEYAIVNILREEIKNWDLLSDEALKDFEKKSD